MHDHRTFELARTGGLLLAMTLAYMFFVHRPAEDECCRLEQQIQAHHLDLQHMPVRLAEVEHLREEIRTLQKTGKKSIDTGGMTARILKSISQLAHTHRLSIDRLEPLAPLELSTHQVASVRVQLSGQFEHWNQLLLELDNSPEEFEILDFQLTMSKARNASQNRSVKSEEVSPNTLLTFQRVGHRPDVRFASLAGSELTSSPSPTISGELHIARRLLPESKATTALMPPGQ